MQATQGILSLYDKAREDVERFSQASYAYIQSAHTSYLPLWCYALSKHTGRRLVLVAHSDEYAAVLQKDLALCEALLAMLDDASEPLSSVYVPSWGCAVGTPLSHYAASRMARAHALHDMTNNHKDIATCSVRVWNELLTPPSLLRSNAVEIVKGMACDVHEIAEELVRYNFLRVPQVSGIGEFAIRGEVLDLGMYSGTWRILVDFGAVESISLIDAQPGMKNAHVESLLIHPYSEIVWSDENVERFKHMATRVRDMPTAAVQGTVEKLSKDAYDEYDYLYYPSIYEEPAHVSEYFDEKPLVVFCDFQLLDAEERRYKDAYRAQFLKNAHAQCIPRPETVWAQVEKCTKGLEWVRALHSEHRDGHGLGDAPSRTFSGNARFFEKQAVMQLEERSEARVLVCASGEVERERLKVLLDDELLEHERFSLEVAPFHRGFALEQHGVYVYREGDLFGKKLLSFDSGVAEKIESLDAIEVDDLVVHVQYGIGLFKGLKRMSIQGAEKDFMHIAYKNEEMLYVPIEQMNMVQKYIGARKDAVQVDALGGKGWSARKKKVLQQIEDLSEELLSLQAERNTHLGFSYPEATEWEREFIAQFPFSETQDQLKAWSEIESDMQSPVPMDRLVVGDVGFGKTELAFRAAFKAISAGKQVAFLVPTTILAEQHYNSARERFANFPVSIAMLSRFVDAKTQKKTIAELATGAVELLIGTHRIVQKDIAFDTIGLIVIDEEHRFGVKDKERIKQFKKTVDCLSLSATPIPRTLYQSLIQVRSMSTLTTAPGERKPIKTFVEKYTSTIVRSAIEQELERKGQVFFLHNRVDTLAEVKEYLEELVPTATVLTASGQMSSRELEDTMYTFVHGGANVLVSTTIIENGIDIPSVNTIIIDRADMYGISQLYQLRGRVGRSNKTAYAYLLYPDENRISEVALKRLTTISDYSDLGSGFHVAMRDLEVRGAGNLLGKEQSGSICSVGYEYYLQLLEKTMNKNKGLSTEVKEPVLDLRYTGFIPSTYVSDLSVKMDMYKRIARIYTQEQYQKAQEYFTQAYGSMPPEVQNLFGIAKIKVLARAIQAHTLTEREHAIELHLSNLAHIHANAAMQRAITAHMASGALRMHRSKPEVLVIPCKSGMSLEEKYALLERVLSSIAEKA